jgi:SAM-dependent methyltransferase
MTPALALYAEGLRLGKDLVARFADGSTRPLGVTRWIASADAVDERALRDVCGPVLDIGCGPGRHLHALARRGVFGLGVDLSAAAVGLARDAGARAIVASVFDELPGAGTWQSALLLDGNVGIGGDPVRLLNRVRTLLAPHGRLLVELAGPPALTRATRVRLETSRHTSDWFDWAEVSALDVSAVAGQAGLQVGRCWNEADRWFAVLLR